jgi:hypothetical protein
MESVEQGGLASVYAEAKGEYTKQLTLFVVPSFHRFFMSCLQQAAEEEPQAKRQLWKFQELLSQIPEWNMDKVQREVSRITNDIHCDYLEELVTAVFIAHTKVLTAIRIGNKNKRVQITIPKLEHFLHRSLSECSRLLWSSAYLFHSEIAAIEKQKNHRQIEQLLHEGIEQAIRGLLPVKNILKDYLAEPSGDATDAEDDDDDDEAEHKAAGPLVTEAVAEAVPVVNAAEAVTEPVAESVTEPVSEPVAESTAEAVSEPAATLAQEPVAAEALPVAETPVEPIATEITDKIPIPDEAVAAPVAPAAPAASMVQPPTLVVHTEPSVRFTEYNQVFRNTGSGTDIQYESAGGEVDETDNNLEFLDEDAGSLSDVEDLEGSAPEPLDEEDFEVL